jgi:acyl carrier protein
VSAGDDVEAGVRRIMSVVLKRPIQPGEAVSRAAERGWDSLRHVELVFSIEDEFGVSFDEHELASLDSLDAFVETITRHVAA